MAKRLANVRTVSETGLDYVISIINLNTPFGKKLIREKKPFFPGQEKLLEKEFEKLNTILKFIEQNPDGFGELLRIFMETKDMTFTITRAQKDALSIVELFEIKSLLLKMERISKILSDASVEIPKAYLLTALDSLISALDPRNDRMDTFYIYDEFSEPLCEARKRKKELEGKIRKEQKEQKSAIKSKYGIDLTPKFDYMVSKANPEHIKMIREIPELAQSDEDYVSVTFSIKNTADADAFLREADEVTTIIENEELLVREKLSREIGAFEKELLENCGKIGELDIALSKAAYALERDCVIPIITAEHIIEITEGRHLKVEDTLLAKNKTYCPVSLTLSDGVTCITGANMGGKTVSLKLVGLVALLTQNAFFVPCKKAVVGLSNYMQILIGDNQSLERGLSSFGSEMEVLKEILDNGTDRSLFLIDEIASGTNPAEGFALTKSLVGYLMGKPYISLLTTHFDSVATGGEVKNMQVAGLAEADFNKLDKEIRYADRRERINIISKYMDYKLREVTTDKEVPKDALSIAKILGIKEEIIENAKKYLEGGKG